MPPVSYNLGDLHGILKKEKPSSVCLVTSRKITSKIPWALKILRSEVSNVIYIPDGEKAKEWNILRELLVKFSRLGLDQSSIVIILGGGTIGDLAGFAASIYLRGIRYIQVPTTLVAQVDSAHGSKTGINFLRHKNQIGSFHNPQAIIVDPRFLKSLQKGQIIDGLGEIIKCGLIKDQSILSLLENERVSTIAYSKKLQVLIKKTIEVKDYYVRTDFNDSNMRHMLNFGHTIGHSIELTYGISHGKAVIIGMLKELEFAEMLRLTPTSMRKRLSILLRNLGIEITRDYKLDMKTLLHDKKIIRRKIKLPIVYKIGHSKLVTMDVKELKDFIQLS